jgi:hypothetical protein
MEAQLAVDERVRRHPRLFVIKSHGAERRCRKGFQRGNVDAHGLDGAGRWPGAWLIGSRRGGAGWWGRGHVVLAGVALVLPARLRDDATGAYPALQTGTTAG